MMGERTFKYEKELKELLVLTAKNEKRLKWFDFPYRIDLNQDSHKELVDMVQLMYEK